MEGLYGWNPSSGGLLGLWMGAEEAFGVSDGRGCRFSDLSMEGADVAEGAGSEGWQVSVVGWRCGGSEGCRLWKVH